ncbi:TetR/AcrR family transcriptional regulator [Actinoplanes sp. HUAS TT8]|uniref:TetR/AcrR family transcriptional regulator n=1 Tax=Actinoplanes sp. HUAS TT8 TaxID=3447453 RepID=UPI003F525B4E
MILFVGVAMPRLTDARKELRRTQITEAAVRCFGRNGLERTSIADITAESGLSAGSIYAHYRNKAELVQASAREVLAERAAVLGEYADSDTPPDPEELLARLVAAKDPAAARVAVQLWGEATTDPVIRAIVVDMIERMRALIAGCVTAWLVKVEHHDPATAPERATGIAAQVSDRYQAQLLHLALLHDAQLHDAQGHDAQGHDAQGHDAQGHDAQGHDVQGHDVQGHDVQGHDAQGHDAQRHVDSRHVASEETK